MPGLGKGDIRIVILQRGWVMVGKYSQDGPRCSLGSAYVIRVWGTKNGIGELALNGPTDGTKLDSTNGRVDFHELTVIATIQCNSKKWESICR